MPRLEPRLRDGPAAEGVVHTTISDAKAPHPLDRVNRQFKAQRPNQLWVLDFTCESTWQGWLYVAFVVAVFARRIVGWWMSNSMRTDFVLGALEQALYTRKPQRDSSLIQHSDRGTQHVSIRYSERLSPIDGATSVSGGHPPSPFRKGRGADASTSKSTPWMG